MSTVGRGTGRQIDLSCFPGPESNESSLRGMLLLPSGSGARPYPLAASSHWAKVSVVTTGSLLVDISIVGRRVGWGRRGRGKERGKKQGLGPTLIQAYAECAKLT